MYCKCAQMRCELQTDSWKNSNLFKDVCNEYLFINNVRLPLVTDGVDLPTRYVRRKELSIFISV